MTDTLNRTAKLTNIIVFGTQPIPGDSGCAIIEDRGDGTVRLVGFNSHQQKGPNDAANVYSYGGAVTWASVRDAMGGSSVVSVMN